MKNLINKEYKETLKLITETILKSRVHAARLVNVEMLKLYWFTGGVISTKAKQAKWGDKVLEQLSEDIQREMPGLKGFSSQNLKKMRQFYEAWPLPPSIGSALPNQLGKKGKTDFGSALPNQIQAHFSNIGFTNHFLIISKTRTVEERKYYIEQASANNWSSRTLEHHLKSKFYKTQGRLPHNFDKTLPRKVSAATLRQFKDEYLLDYIDVDESHDERMLENEIVKNIRDFLMSLGTGFTFIGNQYRLIVYDDEFFIDLLFYNRNIQALVAFELKRGRFKAEYAGQLNFYLNVLDDKVKLPHENQSVGIILCKEKSDTLVKYAIGGINKPMGVAIYKTKDDLPEIYRRVLPEPEQLRKLMNETNPKKSSK